MLSFRTLATFVGVAALIAVLFYAIPTAFEFWLSGRGVPAIGLIIVGDLLGCVAIFYIARGFGATLYIILSVLEFALYQLGAITPHALVWAMDIVPSLCLVVMAFLAVGVMESSLDLN